MERRLSDVRRGRKIVIYVDGAPMEAYEGETVAAALIAAGHVAFRRTARNGSPRGLYCGMGVCFDCLVQVESHTNQRACMTAVKEGMRVSSQVAWGLA